MDRPAASSVSALEHDHDHHPAKSSASRTDRRPQDARSAGGTRVDAHGSSTDPDDVRDEQLATATTAVTLLTNRVDAAFLDAAPNLRHVANVAVGYNNIDVPACTARGVTVTNT